jgi:hypothetical protein
MTTDPYNQAELDPRATLEAMTDESTARIDLSVTRLRTNPSVIEGRELKEQAAMDAKRAEQSVPRAPIAEAVEVAQTAPQPTAGATNQETTDQLSALKADALRQLAEIYEYDQKAA